MRSVYGTFGGYFDSAYSRKIKAPLRYTAQTLGAVRDLDVFQAKTWRYIDAELGGNPTSLKPLLRGIARRQEVARLALVEWFDSRKYTRFVERFHAVLSQPHALPVASIDGNGPRSTRVDHVLPTLLYERWEAVRRYEDFIATASVPTLHELRIEFKRLRYSLEFFEDVLGQSAGMLIRRVKEAQDHLGDMNDAQVAVSFLRVVGKALPKDERSGIRAYRDYRQAEMDTLVATFPQMWERFNAPKNREALGLAVAAI
ncbi:MAG: CHAD domain-containing protein [Anaerolineae bacterium]|nr:CHAD domain-containing protein [Anaerolineae bacterium]